MFSKEESNNDKKSRLTLDELRTFKGLEHIRDEEGNAAIDTLEKYAILIYELYIKQKKLTP